MDFQEAIARVKQSVDEALRRFFAQKRKEAARISGHCVILADQVAALTLRGGKRTRAFLVRLGYETVKGKDEDALLSAMMAIELFQSFALIHDDIIDGDTTRRGGPTVHTQVGVNMAILAGDLAIAWADEAIAHIKNQKVTMVYQQMKEEVILGQSLDVLAAAGLPSADRETINRYKTAWYSVIRPLQIGASVGGANEKVLASFVPYGLVVGEAYQLRDDVLDGTITQSDFMKKTKHLTTPRSAPPMLKAFARFALERNA